MNKIIDDMELNQNSKLKPIVEIANKIGIKEDQLITFGKTKAKIVDIQGNEDSKLVLVTAINPTKAGEGKTTVSIGLTDSLNKMGHKTILALREPSLGPVFGVKGGATGGGYSQVAPIDEINFHFTGDIHAITSANNLIAAMIDNHIHWGNELGIENITFKKCIDMNDRTLRKEFQITAASEIMAIFTLAKDLDDLRKRINKIIIGSNKEGKPIFVKQLKITGSIIILLKDAFKPNLVQTLENNPVLIHGGPFANIAHGCNSIVATSAAMKLGEITVTEAGFGSDLGAEKFLNIKSRQGNFNPNIVVIVVTIKSLKMHGGVLEKNLYSKNIDALKKGIKLLEKHISNITNFNINYVIALNEFKDDDESEKLAMKEWATKNNHPLAFASVWKDGGDGGKELSKLVLDNMSDKKINHTYEVSESIKVKIEKIAKGIYGTEGITYSSKAEEAIKFLEENKLDKQYICIAKTPSSISDNVKLKGLPSDWKLNVRNIKVSNGAGFIVVYCGSILTMPGLSKKPQAERIDFDGEKIIKLY